jgi:hypothetical protein
MASGWGRWSHVNAFGRDLRRDFGSFDGNFVAAGGFLGYFKLSRSFSHYGVDLAGKAHFEKQIIAF